MCPAFDTLGKDEYGSQQIPEDILEAKVAEVGGLEDISQILVPGKNALTFIFEDGSSREVEWAHPSRRHSWTPEMREAARRKALERHRKGDS